MIVWMYHPNLPSDQLIRVPEDAVMGHRQSGWRETEPPAPPDNSDLEVSEELDPDPAAVESRPETITAQDGEE